MCPYFQQWSPLWTQIFIVTGYISTSLHTLETVRLEPLFLHLNCPDWSAVEPMSGVSGNVKGAGGAGGGLHKQTPSVERSSSLAQRGAVGPASTSGRTFREAACSSAGSIECSANLSTLREMLHFFVELAGRAGEAWGTLERIEDMVMQRAMFPTASTDGRAMDI